MRLHAHRGVGGRGADGGAGRSELAWHRRLVARPGPCRAQRAAAGAAADRAGAVAARPGSTGAGAGIDHAGLGRQGAAPDARQHACA